MVITQGGTPPQNRLPKLIAAAAFFVAAARAGYWGYASQHPHYDRPKNQAWFFDASTKKLFAAATSQISPTKAPSGGDGFRAHVFSCDQCGSVTEADIGYLERAPEGVVNALHTSNGTDPRIPKVTMRERAMNAAELTTPDHLDTWVPAREAAGIAIKHAAETKCGGKAVPECLPR